MLCRHQNGKTLAVKKADTLEICWWMAFPEWRAYRPYIASRRAEAIAGQAAIIVTVIVPFTIGRASVPA